MQWTGQVLTTDLHPNTATSISNLAQDPAHISAEHLVADTARGHAVYSGKGRLWQGQSEIEGDTTLGCNRRINVSEDYAWSSAAAWSPGQEAATIWRKTTKSLPNKTVSRTAHPAPQLGHVRGELLTYWETESRARVENDARVDSEQGSIQANRIDLYFSDSGASSGTKQLSRSVANGDVTVRQEDRRGTSERAEYTASEGKFVLSGR